MCRSYENDAEVTPLIAQAVIDLTIVTDVTTWWSFRDISHNAVTGQKCLADIKKVVLQSDICQRCKGGSILGAEVDQWLQERKIVAKALKKKTGAHVIPALDPPLCSAYGQPLVEQVAILDRRVVQKGNAAVSQVLV
ncbi:hypothetical protein KY284_001357 [Solanum tuberosum]|nr:hypothetical protein KY284_001357 [Solanum tuberosum]